MSQDSPDKTTPDRPDERKLPPAAVRALDEARQRREQQAAAIAGPAELDGPKGPEPTRYGDWERNGIASDF